MNPRLDKIESLLSSVLSELVGLRSDVRATLDGLRSDSRPSKPQDALVGPVELAALLGLHKRTIRRMTEAGQLPKPLLVRGKPRWRREVVAMLAKGKTR